MPQVKQTFRFDQHRVDHDRRSGRTTASTKTPHRPEPRTDPVRYAPTTAPVRAPLEAKRQGRRFEADSPLELYHDRSFCYAWSLVWLRSWFDAPGLTPKERHRFLLDRVDTVDDITSAYWGAPGTSAWAEREDETAQRLSFMLGGLHARSSLRSSRHHRGFVTSLEMATAEVAPPRGFALGYDWADGGHAVAMFVTGIPERPALFFDSEHGETVVTAKPDGSEQGKAIRLLVTQWASLHRHIDVTRYTYRSVSI